VPAPRSWASAPPGASPNAATPSAATPSASTPSALIATKVRVPHVRRQIVPRDGLVERLVAGESGRLTLVSAPAGWGKSTLVLEWLRRAGDRRVAWLSLEPDDADPTRFWAYVVHALARALPAEMAATVRLVDGRRLDVDGVLVPSLVNAVDGAAAGRTELVLDDYHCVSSDALDRQVARLVDHLPAGLHLVVLTRVRPALPLARLRARGELCELTARDLRFSPAETRSLLTDTLGLHLAPADVAALHRRTEGWAAALHLAALHLAALSLRSRGDRGRAIATFGAHEHLVDYLVGEVLSGLDDDLRGFVTETSVLDRLSAPLCEAVTRRPDAGRLLERAEQANLFLLPVDDRGEWYRYHQLFAGVLRLQLGRDDPERLPLLHARASDWFAAAGQASEAVRHALASGDLDAAERLVGVYWNHEYNIGHLATVSGWLGALGDERVRRDPWLSAARVMIWADEGQLDELDAWLEADAGGTVDGYPFAVLRALHRFKSGDLARAAQELDGAARLRSQSEPFWPTVEHCLRGAVAYWSGDPATARTAAAAAATLARAYDNVAGLTYALGYLGLVALDDGDTAAAGRRLAQAACQLEPGSDLASHFVLALPLLAAGQLALLRDDATQALAPLQRAVSSARRGAGRLERIATLAALGRALERADRHREGAVVLREATALLRLCADPRRAATLLGDQPGAPRPSAGGALLTPRESALLMLLPSALSLREIAQELYVSRNTVKTHSRTLYRKLSASTREEAVEAARAGGLL
jgi:LuxR family maltose regulon positive regulatory protein